MAIKIFLLFSYPGRSVRVGTFSFLRSLCLHQKKNFFYRHTHIKCLKRSENSIKRLATADKATIWGKRAFCLGNFLNSCLRFSKVVKSFVEHEERKEFWRNSILNLTKSFLKHKSKADHWKLEKPVDSDSVVK